MVRTRERGALVLCDEAARRRSIRIPNGDARLNSRLNDERAPVDFDALFARLDELLRHLEVEVRVDGFEHRTRHDDAVLTFVLSLVHQLGFDQDFEGGADTDGARRLHVDVHLEPLLEVDVDLGRGPPFEDQVEVQGCALGPAKIVVRRPGRHHGALFEPGWVDGDVRNLLPGHVRHEALAVFEAQLAHRRNDEAVGRARNGVHEGFDARFREHDLEVLVLVDRREHSLLRALGDQHDVLAPCEPAKSVSLVADVELLADVTQVLAAAYIATPWKPLPLGLDHVRENRRFW